MTILSRDFLEEKVKELTSQVVLLGSTYDNLYERFCAQLLENDRLKSEVARLKKETEITGLIDIRAESLLDSPWALRTSDEDAEGRFSYLPEIVDYGFEEKHDG